MLGGDVASVATDEAIEEEPPPKPVEVLIPRKLKVAQLRTELKKRGRSHAGKKSELVARLEELLELEGARRADAPSPPRKAGAP